MEEVRVLLATTEFKNSPLSTLNCCVETLEANDACLFLESLIHEIVSVLFSVKFA